MCNNLQKLIKIILFVLVLINTIIFYTVFANDVPNDERKISPLYDYEDRLLNDFIDESKTNGFLEKIDTNCLYKEQ